MRLGIFGFGAGRVGLVVIVSVCWVCASLLVLGSLCLRLVW